MDQRFLELARLIDQNEDEINDALEADEIDKASELAKEKERLIKEISEVYQTITDPEDKKIVTEYLETLINVTRESIEILTAQHEEMRKELMQLKRGSRGQNQYQAVRGYRR